MVRKSAGIASATAAFFLLVGQQAVAGPRDDALDAVSKCASVVDDHARLACYDAAAAQVKSALAAPVEAQPTAEEQKSWFGLPDIFGGSSRPPQTTPQQFGNESLPPPPPPPPVPGQPAPPPPPQIIDRIAAGVSDYAFNPLGKVVVFLDNGQIWQQIPGDTDRVVFKKSVPNKVTISRALFGSYSLQVNGSGASIKVRRLK